MPSGHRCILIRLVRGWAMAGGQLPGWLLAFQSHFSSHVPDLVRDPDSVSEPKSSLEISFLPKRLLLLLETKPVMHASSSACAGIRFPCLFSLGFYVSSSWKPALTSQAGSAARSELPCPALPTLDRHHRGTGLSLLLDCGPRAQHGPAGGWAQGRGSRNMDCFKLKWREASLSDEVTDTFSA